jgi:hypothetical protein
MDIGSLLPLLKLSLAPVHFVYYKESNRLLKSVAPAGFLFFFFFFGSGSLAAGSAGARGVPAGRFFFRAGPGSAEGDREEGAAAAAAVGMNCDRDIVTPRSGSGPSRGAAVSVTRAVLLAGSFVWA